MILLMLAVCLLLRLRLVGIKIDFWFWFLTVRGLAVAPAGLLNTKLAQVGDGDNTGQGDYENRDLAARFKVIRSTSPISWSGMADGIRWAVVSGSTRGSEIPTDGAVFGSTGQERLAFRWTVRLFWLNREVRPPKWVRRCGTLRAISAWRWDRPQSLAGVAMLRRRRIPAVAAMGVAKDSRADTFTAHAWLSCGGVILTGAGGYERYQVIINFILRWNLRQNLDWFNSHFSQAGLRRAEARRRVEAPTVQELLDSLYTEAMIAMLNSEQILSRRCDVFSTEAGGEVALMSVPNGRYYALNSVASEIWRKLEHPTAVGQLASALEAEYEGDPGQIEKDLRETLDEWLAHRLITVGAW